MPPLTPPALNINDLWDRLFTPDVLAVPPPEPMSARSGCHALLLAVLHEAVHAYQDGVYRSSTRARRIAAEAAAWFAETEDRGVFAFESICDALHLNAAGIRKGLKAWSAQDHSQETRTQRQYTRRQVACTRAA